VANLRAAGYIWRERGNLTLLSPLCVYISHPPLLWKLRAYLQRVGCIAEQRRAHELEVYLPDARSDKDGRRNLDVSLASWQWRNMGVETYVIETARAA
jgi:hypothetical protein